MIVSLRLLTFYRTDYNSMVQKLMLFSVRVVQRLCQGTIEEECLEVWFVAMQSIIECCEIYKEHISQHAWDLDEWSVKGKLTKDMGVIVDQLISVLL